MHLWPFLLALSNRYVDVIAEFFLCLLACHMLHNKLFRELHLEKKVNSLIKNNKNVLILKLLSIFEKLYIMFRA